jgi:hypothetical protein
MCIKHVASLKDAHAAEGRCTSIEIYGTDEHGCRVANVDEAESSRRASRPKHWLGVRQRGTRGYQHLSFTVFTPKPILTKR